MTVARARGRAVCQYFWGIFGVTNEVSPGDCFFGVPSDRTMSWAAPSVWREVISTPPPSPGAAVVAEGDGTDSGRLAPAVVDLFLPSHLLLRNLVRTRR